MDRTDRRARLTACLLLAAWLGAACQAWALPDFTFLHLSDCHFPHAAAQTRETLASLPLSQRIRLAPYEVTVPPPSFAIVTGDLTEFGGGSGWWEGYLGLWQGLPFPVYHQLGNHDNTWDCGRPRLRRLHGAPFYAFEQFGAKFIGWDSATPQDPRPSVATEGLLWLRSELERTAPDQPIFFFCHHPPGGREFAGAYERARLLDLLRTRNVALLLVGHGHQARAWQVDGFDAVMGGSTFGAKPGCNVVSVQDDVLRVCHQHVAPEPQMVPLLEKPLPQGSPFLQVTSLSPPDGTVLGPAEPLEWTLRLEPPKAVRAARWMVGGEETGDLIREGDVWRAQLPREAVRPGANTIRFELTDAQERVTSRTMAFWLDGGQFRIAWKRQLSGSCQSTPTVADGRLFIGANDGCLYAYEAASGRLLWRFTTGGEVRSQPAVDQAGRLIYFGSADGSVYAVTRDGEPAWRSDVGSPVYASPLLAQGMVVCGTSGGDVVALDGETGGLLWRSEAPEYAIESGFAVGEGAVYAGAWDRFVYALGLANGALRWRVPSRGSDREGTVARYYSPADCAPAVAGRNLFVADRAYYLTILDALTGERLLTEQRCAAASGSAEGRFVYVRHTDNRVSKRLPDGSVVWEAQAPTGFIATPPVAAHGSVWMLSTLGTLCALDDETGRLAAQYKAFPDVYAFAAPACDGQRVYVADMAGHLLALAPTWPR
ncbi:MAG: PQQ-binding-like beta-propeller repeat protein [Armatimonadota bacterium]